VLDRDTVASLVQTDEDQLADISAK